MQPAPGHQKYARFIHCLEENSQWWQTIRTKGWFIGWLEKRFWGQRVADLGAGPEPIPRRRLTVDRLVGALRAAVSQPVMRHSAANLGAQIRREDGIGQAVAIVETIA